MNTFLRKLALWSMLLGLSLATPTAEGFLSPKQKGKILKQQRVQRELPGHEYIYHSTWFCSTVGALSVCFGLFAMLDGFFNPYLPGSDKFILSLGGGLFYGWGIYLMKHTFRGDPALIINEQGIRSPDFGLILWEEIKYITIDPSIPSTNATMHVVLDDESTVIIDGMVLSSNRQKLLRKIQRFKTIYYNGYDTVILT